MTPEARPGRTLRRLPAGIWALGFVSLFMDVSSELIHSLLPVFIVSGLGAGTIAVGIIEGIGEAAALIVRVFSGAFSDFLGRRKAVAVAGYGLAALSKPLFAAATNVGIVLTARIIDRLGKGIRGAPRDALVAEIAPQDARGAAYGLRQSLDTVGAFAGPALAVGLMLLWDDDFRAVFSVAIIPAVLSVVVLFFGVREPDRPPRAERINPLHGRELRRLGRRYWWVAAVGVIFTMARFSEAFLILRARDAGVAVAWSPFVLIVMNAVYAMSAYPFGSLSDRMSHRRLLRWGLATLIAADLALALGGNVSMVFVGIALWGLHMGMTQGLLAAMVAATVDAEFRGTAFGVFGLLCGLATLASNVVAGVLWHAWGADLTFAAGAAFSVLAMMGLARIAEPRPT